MVNPKALAAKDKGNLAFKAGDFPTAIGHYTAAILADRTDATFPLNRAAAYLKLGKYEDAERDCTAVLGLSKNNVKALFRRGQARVGIGKLFDAHKDFSDVLFVEPSNIPAQDELKNVVSLIQKEKSKKSKVPISPVQSSLAPEAIAAKRRRVPIRIIETSATTTSASATSNSELTQISSSSTKAPEVAMPSTGTNTDSNIDAQSEHKTVGSPQKKIPDTLEALSSRSLKASSSPPLGVAPVPSKTTAAMKPSETPKSSAPPLISTPASSQPAAPKKPKLETFKDAKQAREGAKPSRVGGGIFRASGQNTIFPVRGEEVGAASASASTPMGVSEPQPTTPRQIVPTTSGTTAASVNPVALVEVNGNDNENSTGSVLNHKPSSPSPGAPPTLFDFTKAWGKLRTPVERWDLMNTIPPAQFPALCKTSFEPSLLISILDMFLSTLTSAGEADKDGVKPQILAYLTNFTHIPRFSTLVLFLSKPEKEVARDVWRLLDVDRPGGAWKVVS